MTLNEVRDILVKRYPGHSVKVGAECWHHDHCGHATESTKFDALLFAPGSTDVKHRVETTKGVYALVALMEEAMMVANGHGLDQPAEATPEPACPEPAEGAATEG